MTIMKKCGILTISVGIMNYGNRLQNYSLQQVLENYGYEVRTVNYKPKYPESSYATVPVNKLKKYKTYALKAIFYLRNKVLYREKSIKFNHFTTEKIHWTDEIYSIDSDFRCLSKEFDNIVCGSDQVWNPYWEGTQPFYFMQFMPFEKRVAYAASLGVESIPDDMKASYTDYFKNIKYISCREDRGVEIVNELGGIATQVLDPVFLINVDAWKKIEKRPEKLKTDKYVLAYFLGDIERKTQQYLDKLRNQGYSVIYLDRKDKLNSIFASPVEFLYLVNHCKLLCTDSFHGCAFSIIFNKPFVCFERSLNNGSAHSMNSRMTSLFNLFKCEERFASRLSTDPFAMDYSTINKIIDKERKKSLEFLEVALNDRK